jgi:hypothetical protein
MAPAISASALLSSAFSGDRRQRRAARPAPRRAVPAGLTVRCEQSDKQKRQPLAALVPREQRFMFEGDELCGPVRTPFLYHFLPISCSSMLLQIGQCTQTRKFTAVSDLPAVGLYGVVYFLGVVLHSFRQLSDDLLQFH